VHEAYGHFESLTRRLLNETIAKILKLYCAGPVKGSKRQILRSEKEVLAFFGDMELVEPGIASIWTVGGVAALICHRRLIK
jgi:hypothetical protein